MLSRHSDRKADVRLERADDHSLSVRSAKTNVQTVGGIHELGPFSFMEVRDHKQTGRFV
jgi:hypothetical protein